MATRKAILQVGIDARDAKHGAKEATSAIDSIRNKAIAIDKTLKTLATGMAGYFTFRAIKASLTYSIGQFIEQEHAISQVTAALKSTNYTSGMTVDSLNRLASSMQKTTNYGDEMVLNASAIGLSFTNITKDVFPAFIQAAADVSTRMGQDLNSTVVQLGKALNDPIQGLSALGRTGIQFSDDQEKVIKRLVETNKLVEAQDIILKEIQKQYGGSASAARDTLGGSLSSLKNSFGDLTQAVTGLFVPALNSIVGTADTIVQATTAALSSKEKTDIEKYLEKHPSGKLPLGSISPRTELRALEKQYAELLLKIKALQGDEKSLGGGSLLRVYQRQAKMLLSDMAELNDMILFGKKGPQSTASDVEQVAALKPDLKIVKQLLVEINPIADEIGDAIGRAFGDAVRDIRNADDALKNLLSTLSNIAIRELIEKPMSKAIGSFLTGGGYTGETITIMGGPGGVIPIEVPSASKGGTTINVSIDKINGANAAQTRAVLTSPKTLRAIDHAMKQYNAPGGK